MSLFTWSEPPDARGYLSEWPAATVFAVGVCLATAGLVWFGYVAAREWSHGSDLLLERRQAETLALLGVALNRDMKGASTTVLVPISQVSIEEEPPYDLLQLVARAFAKFPYPESFIIWKHDRQSELSYAFNRANRQPHWDHRNPSDDPFPVVLLRDPLALQEVIADARARARPDSPFIAFETSILGRPYQVVAHLLFESATPHALSAVVAFTVNLQWVRQEYLGPLLGQVARIGGNEETLVLSVTDERGQLVATTGELQGVGDAQRRFPLLFIDSALVPSSLSSEIPRGEWAVNVRHARDNTLLAARGGSRRTFVAMVLAAAVSLTALLMTVRAIRVSTMLASMRSDFVSAVTHELKTPLALVRLVGDTLSSGRYTSPENIQDYARLLSAEASRLSHSIDNLLSYARYSEAHGQRVTEPVLASVDDLVEDALEQFRPTLAKLQFDLAIDIPSDLPQVAVDRTGIVQAMENIIDNAIKYSDRVRGLRIVGRTDGKEIVATFADRGIGIAEGDIGHVFGRFYRGRNVKEGGSGLGLAIAQRIIGRHHGAIAIRSSPDAGTEVEIRLPAEIRS